MKKRLLLLTLCIVFTASAITGCKKKDNADVKQAEVDAISEEDVKAALADADIDTESKDDKNEDAEYSIKVGTYCFEAEEEIGGDLVDTSCYLLILDGGKGFMIAQDDVQITWDNEKVITDYSEYPYEVTAEDTLVLNEDGMEIEYKYIGADYPEDIVGKMRFFLDGTLRVTNMEAANEFDYLLVSDIIDFYDGNGNVAYSASDEALDGLGAYYYEMGDEKAPILFIKTPEADRKVGYEHILQYNDGRIYDIAGVDEVKEIYLKAGVIVATYMETENGETNYYYFSVGDNGIMSIGAHGMVKDESTYYFVNSNREETPCTNEEFDAWFKGLVGDEEPLTTINWRNVKDTF